VLRLLYLHDGVIFTKRQVRRERPCRRRAAGVPAGTAGEGRLRRRGGVAGPEAAGPDDEELRSHAAVLAGLKRACRGGDGQTPRVLASSEPERPESVTAAVVDSMADVFGLEGPTDAEPEDDE
jgi:hypothetical protein